MTHDISLLAAFVAGVLSLSSPCVLPLVPIYLAHLAGASTGPGGSTSRVRVFSHAIAYVLGFSAVFVLLGIALGAAGAMLGTASFVAGNRFWLVRLGGTVLVLLGLQQLGIVRWPFLSREHRLTAGQLPAGRVTSSFVVGMTFGAGWSPCVGPVLGAILTMASSQGSPQRAALLLTVYSAGLGVPFLLAASFATAPGVIRRLNRNLSTVTAISGTAMLAVGAIMLLGFYQQFFARMVALAPWIPWEPSL